jgi:hypothetical protein
MNDNPKDVAGRNKVPLSLVPAVALAHEAEAFRYGAYEAPRADGGRGYGPYNWRQTPVRASVYVDAALRHLLDYFDGENRAPDSRAHHLGHARACLAIVLDALEQGTLVDDRPTPGTAAVVLARMNRERLARPRPQVQDLDVAPPPTIEGKAA